MKTLMHRFKAWLRVQACKRLNLWPHELYAEAIADRVKVSRRGGKQLVVDITVNVTGIGSEALRKSLCEAVTFELRKKAGWMK